MKKTCIMSSFNNQCLMNYLKQFSIREDKTCASIKAYGLDFDALPEKTLAKKNILIRKLQQTEAHLENNKNSIYINKISPACLRCRTGKNSHTAFLSLKCHRSCYFCFNPNQEQYENYKNSMLNASYELNCHYSNKENIEFIALTGGEPLLFKKDAVFFFEHSKAIYPYAHRRLYTSGDLLGIKDMILLSESGVDEIRFSIKMDDPTYRREKVIARIKQAKNHFKSVMVEMPVIPGTENEMQELLIKLNDIKIHSINLLEFCFPLHNAEAYKKRRLSLKFPPWSIFYNYWYAGGLAVAGSENACLNLLLFAIENKLSIGVHYCSLENKYSGQIYQQNYKAIVDDSYSLSNLDYFFRTAKVFGNDRNKVIEILIRNNVNYIHCPSYHAIQFNPLYLSLLSELKIEVVVSLCVVEYSEGVGDIMKELKAFVIQTDLFSLKLLEQNK